MRLQFLAQCQYTILCSNDAAIGGTDIRAIVPLQLPSSPLRDFMLPMQRAASGFQNNAFSQF